MSRYFQLGAAFMFGGVIIPAIVIDGKLISTWWPVLFVGGLGCAVVAWLTRHNVDVKDLAANKAIYVAGYLHALESFSQSPAMSFDQYRDVRDMTEMVRNGFADPTIRQALEAWRKEYMLESKQRLLTSQQLEQLSRDWRHILMNYIKRIY